MAKIPSKFQRIFCADVSVNNVVAQFGSLKAASPVYSDDPDTLQSLAAWTNGWSDAVLDNNAPTIQDMNGLFYVLTRQIAYLMQAGIPEWNAGITYFIGSIVSDGLGGIYRSLVDTNLNQALTDSTKWFNQSSIKQTEIGDNYAVLASDHIVRWSTAASSIGHRTITLPTPISTLKGKHVVIKIVSPVGGGYIEIVTEDNSTINGKAKLKIVRYQSISFFCDGTRWICTDYFSA
jgi:hypothetical protein